MRGTNVWEELLRLLLGGWEEVGILAKVELEDVSGELHLEIEMGSLHNSS